MANSSWVVPAAVAVFTPMIAAALGKRSSLSIPVDASGMRTLRLPKAFGVIGWVAVGITMLFVFGGVASALKGELLSLFFLLLAVGFGAMAASLVLNGRNHVVSFDRDRLIVTDGRKRTAECAWSSIVSGRVHPLSKMIVLCTTDGRKLRINHYLIGSDDLFRTMAERTTLPVAELVAKARNVG